jgi:hypothetical protein
MKYMLLCYDDEEYWEKAGKAGMEAAMQEVYGMIDDLKAKGQLLDCAPLQPARAKVGANVQVRDGKRMVTDGPYAETREVLGGFWLIDVENLDEAIRVAERHPGARVGTVEIRPVLEIPNLPKI